MELGPLSAIASQPGVTDIAVTCDGTVWADCGQGMQEVCLLRRCFPSAQSIREFAVRLCSQLGRRLDDACPIADASTVDGLRVHAVIAPLVPQGAAISIRLPDAVSPNLESLARHGMFPAEWLPLLAGLVSRKASVLVTGGTGAGKTTMVKLLMRFYDVDSGSITLNGHDIRDFDRSALREGFGMVLQDTWLFKGTIMENIRYGRLDATDEEVIAAAKAQMDSESIRFEDVLTQLEEKRQRLEKAQGEADANDILNSSLSENVLRQKYIDALSNAKNLTVVPDGSVPMVQTK